jgi:multidrug resistance efflux pump
MYTDTRQILDEMRAGFENINRRLDGLEREVKQNKANIEDLRTDRYWERHHANAPEQYAPTRPAAGPSGRAFHEPRDRWLPDHPYYR